MQNIAFYGLGNMGAGMARNLIKAGFNVTVFDLVQANMDALVKDGAQSATSAADAVRSADVVISMLPAGKHVESLYLGLGGAGGEHALVENCQPHCRFIDCSTIEASMAQSLGERLKAKGFEFCDAPVSGGVAGAQAGTLTFIVGGASTTFEAAKPLLEAMGQNIFHAGDIGAGQIAKICNNMMLAILMAGTSETLKMAMDNGLDPKVMSEIMQKSSGNNWTLEKYNPCPGVMPNVPSSNAYQGGFMVDLMNKDLGLAMQTASLNGSPTPMGALAKSLYQLHGQQGNGSLDFSSIFSFYSAK